ncbi:MAG: putative porin [Gammaproteobacteria bacterium]
MKSKYYVGVLCALLATGGPVRADEQADLLQLKQTVLNLMDALVAQGVLTRGKADELIAQAQRKAADAGTADGTGAADAAADVKPGTVRVAYVPEFVKEEIRQQVRQELKQDVLADVKQQAKQERWGTPDALPDWINRFKLSGDFRIRNQYDAFASDNAPLVFDPLAVNAAGTILGTDVFANTVENRNRQRIRARLALNARITDGLGFGARVTTGNIRDPISTNQSLGNTGSRFDIQLDHAFLQYKAGTAEPWLTTVAGRFPSPWFSSDLVWDEDLSFEGVAATYRHAFAGGDTLLDRQDRSRSVFVTAGVFPLQEIERTLFDEARDKWLVGGQIGFSLGFADQSRLTIAAAYYDYQNVQGRRNAFPDTGLLDSTAPQYMQKGNTLFNIRNSGVAGATRLGLASDYNLLNVTTQLDLAYFAPIHVMLTGDVVKNIGFDRDEIFARTGGVLFNNALQGCTGRACIVDRTLAWNVEFTVGWPNVARRGTWQLFGGYRYVERDAALDAFTESDFHHGGTDAKGWVFGTRIGLTENTVLRARYITADEIQDSARLDAATNQRFIDGPPLGIDVLQLDLNAKF